MSIFVIRNENEVSCRTKVFIFRVYYATKSTKLYKKVWEAYLAKYSEVLLILTIMYVVGWKSAWISRVNSASWKNGDVVQYVQEKNSRANFF